MRTLALIGAVCLLAVASISQPTPPERVGPLGNGMYLLNSGWKLSPAGRQVGVGTFPMSCVLSKDGRYLIVLNAGLAPPSLSVVDVANQKEVSRTPVPDGWLGLAFNPKGDRLYVGGGSRAAIFEFGYSDGKLTAARTFYLVDEARRTPRDFTGDVCFSPDGRLLYAADLFHNSLLVVNPLSGVIIQRIHTGRRPYRILFQPDGKSFFVTNWADGTLTQYQASDGSPLGSIGLGPHPTDIVWRHSDSGDQIFVAAANTGFVYTVQVHAGAELSLGDTINLQLTPHQPLGMTPSALALSNDAKTLYVVCSDANAVAKVDLSAERVVVSGFLPTGWYPTAIADLPDGRLAVLNGRNPEPRHSGTVSFIPALDDAQQAAYTRTVETAAPSATANAPAPPAAIKHVIVVLKSDQTYDEVFGDLEGGGNDASLVKFGEKKTPNLHKLARQFVLLDNFYAQGDSEWDGVNWSTAGIASDFVEKLWPNSVRTNQRSDIFEGGDPAALSPAGYLWDNALQAGLTLRNYGFWVQNNAKPEPDGTQIERVRDPQLALNTDMEFRGIDPNVTDVTRAAEFINELHEYEQTGDYPLLTLVQLGGSIPDNDEAIGMVAEAISKSKYWGQTVMFVMSPSGGGADDHIDPHRSATLVVSPFARPNYVEHEMFNTVAVLRTVELILGMRPMTRFDAAATSTNSVFVQRPNPAPYSAVAQTPR